MAVGGGSWRFEVIGGDWWRLRAICVVLISFHSTSLRLQCVFSNLSNVDFQMLADRSSPLWVAGYHDANSGGSGGGASAPGGASKSSSPMGSGFDPWVTCLTATLNSDNLLTACPAALRYAWPIVFERISHLFALVDPK